MYEPTNKAVPECPWNRRDPLFFKLLVFKSCAIDIYQAILQMYKSDTGKEVAAYVSVSGTSAFLSIFNTLFLLLS